MDASVNSVPIRQHWDTVLTFLSMLQIWDFAVTQFACFAHCSMAVELSDELGDLGLAAVLAIKRLM